MKLCDEDILLRVICNLETKECPTTYEDYLTSQQKLSHDAAFQHAEALLITWSKKIIEVMLK